MALNKQQAKVYIEWLSAMGVSDVPAEQPTNFYRIAAPPNEKIITQDKPPTKRKTPPPLQAAETAREKAPSVELTQAVGEAEKSAAASNSLEALKEAMKGFTHCTLSQTATQLVFADGNPKAKVMFIGEAPGEQEDKQGLPFVGAAGKLLDRMLGAIELTRENVYITNLLPWRPPGNRNPLPEERAMFRPFLNKHIELIAPKIIVLLGAQPTKELLETEQGIMKLRGQWTTLSLGGTTYDVLPTFHPAFLLRQAKMKKQSWEDLQALQQKLATLS